MTQRTKQPPKMLQMPSPKNGLTLRAMPATGEATLSPLTWASPLVGAKRQATSTRDTDRSAHHIIVQLPGSLSLPRRTQLAMDRLIHRPSVRRVAGFQDGKYSRQT
jgi:hypothetical protein